MKVKITKITPIGRKIFPPGSVVDVTEPEANALVKSGNACHCSQNLAARMAAYNDPGCVPKKEKTPVPPANNNE